MTEPLLHVAGLVASYGQLQAVRGVSFDVGAGELVAMIGPNGAGKTTCFNIVNGQLRPDSGEVRLAGERLTGLAPRASSRFRATPRPAAR